MSITAQETNPAPGSGACPISARHTPRISGGVLPRPRGQHGLRRPLNVSLLAFVAAARSHRQLSRTSSYAADRSGVDQTVFKAPLAKMLTALLECPGSPERRSVDATDSISPRTTSSRSHINLSLSLYIYIYTYICIYIYI